MSWDKIGVRKIESYDRLVAMFYHHETEMTYEVWADEYDGTIVGASSDSVGLVTWYYVSPESMAWMQDNCDWLEVEE